MTSPPHFMPGSGQPQFQNQSGDNQNDEVVIYFQNSFNRPGGGVPPPPLPPPLAPQSHHHHHHQHPDVRDMNTSDTSPLNFSLPPRPAGVSNEHEAAAYFLAQMGLSRDRELPPHMSVPHPGNRDMPLSPHTGGREQHQGGNHMGNRDLHAPISTQAGNRDLHVPVSSHPNNQGLPMPPSTHPSNNNRELQNVPVSTHSSSSNMAARPQMANHDLPTRTPLPNQDLPARHQMPNQDLPGSSQLSHQDMPITTAVGTNASSQQEPPRNAQDNSARNPDVSSPSQDKDKSKEKSKGECDNVKDSSNDDPGDGKSGPLIGSPLGPVEDKPVPTLETRAMFEALMKPKRRQTPEEKIAYNRLKHPVRVPCNCPRKCFEKIKDKRRLDINYSFWGLSYVERAMFLMAHVKRSTINRKTVKGLSRRKFTLTYSLFDEEDHLVPVCKLHFLGTLGCQSDKVITRLFIKNPVGTLIPEDDMRGKHTPHNKIDVEVVKNHIVAFCKQFAPTSKSKKLFVPPGVTKMQMYNDFKAKFIDFKCGPTRYAQVVSDMNIVFGKKKPQPKPPKPSPSVDSSQFPSTSQQTYNDHQNQNQSFNRSSNFSIPMSPQGPPSQVIVYQGQGGRNLPSMGAMPWDQLDPQLYQGQAHFLNDPSLGAPDNRNSGQNQGFPGPCGMMMPPGFNLPGTGSGNPAAHLFGRNMDGSGRPNNPDGRSPQDGGSGRPTPNTLGGRPDTVTGRPAPESAAGRPNSDSGTGRPNPGGAGRPPNLQGVGRPNVLGGNNAGGSGQSSQQATGLNQPQPGTSKTSGDGSTSHKPKKPPRKRINIHRRNIPKRSKMIEDAKIAHRRLKYALLPPCNCPRNCVDKIGEERRSLINFLFWGLQYHMRAMFLLNHIKQTVTKRCKSKDVSRRKYSRNYTLPDEKDHLQSVCKIFFLHTLGYTSDTVITKLLKKNPIGTVTPVADNRGKHEPPNKIDTSLVKEHVTGHQRRTSKGKLRLPPDISIKLMYADFKAKQPDFKCGYERYRQVVQEIRVKERKRGDKS